MPIITLFTNMLKREASIEKDFAIKISATVSQCLEQPDHHYVMTKIVSETTMTFMGTDEPCACIKVGVTGTMISPKTCEATRTSLTDLICAEYGMLRQRVFVDV